MTTASLLWPTNHNLSTDLHLISTSLFTYIYGLSWYGGKMCRSRIDRVVVFEVVDTCGRLALGESASVADTSGSLAKTWRHRSSRGDQAAPVCRVWCSSCWRSSPRLQLMIETLDACGNNNLIGLIFLCFAMLQRMIDWYLFVNSSTVSYPELNVYTLLMSDFSFEIKMKWQRICGLQTPAD